MNIESDQWLEGDPPEPGVYETLHDDGNGNPYSQYSAITNWDGSNWNVSYQWWPIAWRYIK